jgi:hypothetical protein
MIWVALQWLEEYLQVDDLPLINRWDWQEMSGLAMAEEISPSGGLIREHLHGEVADVII